MAQQIQIFYLGLAIFSKEKNRDPADLWQTLTLERFLVRLAKSERREHFVLIGWNVWYDLYFDGLEW